MSHIAPVDAIAAGSRRWAAILFAMLLAPAAHAAGSPPVTIAQMTVDEGGGTAGGHGRRAPADSAGDFAVEGQVRLDAEQWARPRSGDAIVRLESLNRLVSGFSERRGGHIVIRYAGGDEGTLWAAELRAWLVALGIPSTHIRLRPGAATADALTIVIQYPQTE